MFCRKETKKLYYNKRNSFWTSHNTQCNFSIRPQWSCAPWAEENKEGCQKTWKHVENTKNYLARSNHSQKFLRIGVTKKFAGLKPATLLKRDFNISVPLWILQNYKNSIFIEHLRWLLEFGLNSTTTFKWCLNVIVILSDNKWYLESQESLGKSSAPEESKKRAKIEMKWSRNSPTQLALTRRPQARQ